MSAQNNRNRKLENLVGNVHLAPHNEKTACFMYDFGTQAGAISAIAMTNAEGKVATLPDNAMITGASWDVVTALASSGSATVALGTNNAIVSGWAANAAVADHEGTSYICVAATKWIQVG